MKLLLRLIFVVLPLFGVTNTFSQNGILIFEISDAQNKPVVGLSIDVKTEGAPYKTYTTDDMGRVVDPVIPAGSYSYYFQYGDFNADTFNIESGDYEWINLDYRSWNFDFRDSDDQPLEGKKVTIYRVDADRNETFLCEKLSDEEGKVSFLLPEGEYKYTTFKGSDYVYLQDRTKNTSIEVTSGVITHETFFRFVDDEGTPLSVFARDVFVVHIAPDSVYDFGSADAHSEAINYAYYEYNKTFGAVSCSAGTYACSVQTKEYGTIRDTFVVDDNDPLKDNVIDLVIPTIHDTSSSSMKEKVERNPGSYSSPSKLPCKLRVKVYSEKDSITPLPYVQNYLFDPLFPSEKSEKAITDKTGTSYWATDTGYYSIVVMDMDTMHNVFITRDTTVCFYVDPDLFTTVYFDFYFNGEKYYPISVPEMEFTVAGNYIYHTGLSVGSGYSYSDDNPIVLPPGNYWYFFDLEEKNYDESFREIFVCNSTKKEIRIPIYLTQKYEVTLELRDINGQRYQSRQYVEMRKGRGSVTRVITDEMGKYSQFVDPGLYTFSALGDTVSAQINSDTTLYLQCNDVARGVYFKFLHDGIVVYPQIMSMDIYRKSDDALYSRAVSHLTRVDGASVMAFDEKTLCKPDDYYVRYTLKDYEVYGTFNTEFNVLGNMLTDTTIYLVVPVKRTVTITVKDANRALVTGVNATIYRYDENGVLQTNAFYDGVDHSGIRTNSNALIIDHLYPGRYQLRILDIQRDFIVSDYDLNMEVISGVNRYDVKYYVLDENTRTPIPNLLLETKKEDEAFGTSRTNNNGLVEIFAEEGDYSYHLYYGDNHDGSYHLKKDTTIYIYVETPKLVDSMYITSCPCVSKNDTLPLNCVRYPDNATTREYEWSVDNEALAHVTSDGVLISHDVELNGYVTVSVTAKDGKGISTSRKFYVNSASCAPSVGLKFSNTADTDIPRNSDTIRLALSATSSPIDRIYLYQYSTDSTYWTSLGGPTTDTEIDVPVDTFEKDVHFRVLASGTAKDLLLFAEDTADGCDYNVVSNLLTLRVNHIRLLNWPDSICSNRPDLTLAVDSASFGNMADGYFFAWYSKSQGDSAFADLNHDGAFKIPVTLDSTTTFRVALKKDSVITKFVDKTIFVDQMPDFSLSVSKDSACWNDSVRISVDLKAGEVSYLWNDSTTASYVDVWANHDTISVNVSSVYRVCPSKSDFVVLTVDHPVDFKMHVDRTEMCSIDTKGFLFHVDSLTAKAGSIVWSNGAAGDSLRIAPAKSDSVSVKVTSLNDLCPSVTKSIPVKVFAPLAVKSFISKDSVCLGDTVTMGVALTSGIADSYLWDNGKTDTSVTIVAEAPKHSVTITSYHNVCPALVDTFTITIDHPVDFKMHVDRTEMCSIDTKGFLFHVDSLTAKAGSIVWSNGAAGDSLRIAPAKSDSVSVKVTSLNDLCPSVTKSIPVKVFAPLAVKSFISKDSVCLGDTVTMGVALTSGIADSYLWDNGKTDTSVTIVAEAPKHSVTITSYHNVCPALVDTFTITIDQPIDFKMHVDRTEMCSIDTKGFLFHVDSLTSKAGSVVWSNGAVGDSLRLVPAQSETISVKVTSLNDLCPSVTKLIPVHVYEPLAVRNFISKDSVCLGDTVGMSVALTSGIAGSYTWDEGMTDSTIMVSAKDKPYIVNVESYHNVCPMLVDTFVLTVDTPIDYRLLAGRTEMCSTDAQGFSFKIDSLTAKTGSMVWSNGMTGDSLHIVPAQSETISVKATSLNNLCPSVTKSIPVHVYEPLAVKNFISKDSVCLGDTVGMSVALTSGVASSYTWDDGMTDSSVTVSAKDKPYVVSVTSYHNICPMLVDTLTLTIDTPVDFRLTADRTEMCATDAKGFSFKVDSLTAKSGSMTWSNGATGDSLHVVPAQSETISVKVTSLNNLCPAVTKSVPVFVYEPLVITSQASRDSACLNDTINLSVFVLSGNIGSYLWNDGMTDSSVVVKADDKPYIVTVNGFHDICPAKKDTIRLKIDRPIDFALLADKYDICSVDTVGVHLSIDTLGTSIGKIVWSDGSEGYSLIVDPKENVTVTATALSLNSLCPSVTKEAPIKVHYPLAVSLFADTNSICQTGSDTVVLKAQVISGEATSFHWWNGVVTAADSLKIVPQENVSPWVYVSDGVCADSDSDTTGIVVAKPSSVTISSPDKVFEYGSDIHLDADTASFLYGPFSWYSVDANGDVNDLGATDENHTTDLPDGDVSYYVLVGNGACPLVRSNTISMHLIDNVVVPTIFTPYTVDGENDDFMPGYKVIVYDRYGDVITDSDNGWDGYYKGELAEPGVYFYMLTLKDERTKKGTVEIFRK